MRGAGLFFRNGKETETLGPLTAGKPMAAMVTGAPVSSSSSISAGMAVIALDFSAPA